MDRVFVEKRMDWEDKKKEKTHHITNPHNPPKNVLIIRTPRLNAVSPRNRERVIWPMNIPHRNLFSANKGSERQS
jgi:hypothetical protein